jgi:hypothetical protein
MTKTYAVTIRATITKMYQVTSTDMDSAIVQAHEIFSAMPDDAEEKYEQETVLAWEVDHA